MYRHHPQTLRVVELARSGALGRLELVSGTFSFFLANPDDPRAEPGMGGGSTLGRRLLPGQPRARIAGEEPDRLSAFARFDDRGIDLTFIGQLHFPSGLLGQFDSGFAAPDRERVEIVGSDATLVLDAPFLPQPDGPPPSVTLWRGRAATADRRRLDRPVRGGGGRPDRRILDGRAPRLTLASSRGNVATLVGLDRIARANAGLLAD